MEKKRGDNRLSVKAPALFAEIDRELTAKFYPLVDIDSITHGSVKVVWWNCPKGHQWDSRVDRRYAHQGCPYCTNKRVRAGYNALSDTHPELLEEWDYKRNLDIQPTDVISGSTQKVWWRCVPYGHSWESQIKSRVFGYGCPICANVTILPGFNDFAVVYPDETQEWDYTKNNFSPQTVSPKSSKKAWWICRTCNHSWKTYIRYRSVGKGCPKCSSGKTEKAFTQAIAEISGYEFSSTYVTGRRRLFTSSRIQVDAFSEELGVILEYDGEWTHGPNNPQKKSYSLRLFEDADTTETLLNKGYKVIRIREEPLEFVSLNPALLKESSLQDNLVQISYSSKESIEDTVHRVYESKLNWFS